MNKFKEESNLRKLFEWTNGTLENFGNVNINQMDEDLEQNNFDNLNENFKPMISDYNKRYQDEDEFWVKLSPNKKNIINFKGNFISDCKLVISKDDNINEILSGNLVINHNKIPELFDCSLRLLNCLSYLIEGKKIKYSDGEIIIPLYVFQMFDKKGLDISNINLNYCYEWIYINGAKNINYSLMVKVGLCKNEISNDIHHNDYIFETQTIDTKRVDSEIIKINIDLIPRDIFIVVWYIIEKSHFSEMQGFQPYILKIELSYELNGKTFTKEFSPNDIKKIKTNNYYGYIIPVNSFKFNDLLTILKNKKIKTILPKFKKMFYWPGSVCYVDLKIYWSNFQPGSEIVIENLGLRDIENFKSFSSISIKSIDIF